MPSHLSRRTVLGAGAWSVPVIATALATPALAASTAPTVTVGALREPLLRVQYLDITFTGFPEIPALEVSGAFISICLPEGVDVTNITSSNGVPFLQPETDVSEAISYNTADLPAAVPPLTGFVVTAELTLIDPIASLTGTLTIDVLVEDVIYLYDEPIAFQFGPNAMPEVHCGAPDLPR